MEENPAPMKEISECVAARLGIAVSDLPQPGIWAQSGNTIGALALRVNLLTIDQVDEIINAQETSRKLFGEIAIELGFVQKSDVDRLLELQRFYWIFEIGELVYLRRDADLPELLELYAEFIRAQRAIDAS